MANDGFTRPLDVIKSQLRNAVAEQHKAGAVFSIELSDEAARHVELADKRVERLLDELWHAMTEKERALADMRTMVDA